MKPTQLDASLNSGFIPPENGYSNFRGGAIVDRLLMFFFPFDHFPFRPHKVITSPSGWVHEIEFNSAWALSNPAAFIRSN